MPRVRQRCEVCGKPAKARRLCPNHYQQWFREHGTGRVCRIKVCDRAEYDRATGYCYWHYCQGRYGRGAQERRVGGYVPSRTPAVERFWPKVDKDGPVPAHRPDLGPCWLWTGALTTSVRGGYARLWGDEGRYVMAHVFAYRLLVGPVPEGLELDHLCCNRGCVNPAHLEPVTHAENLRRSRSHALSVRP